jgi:hypothetical protein
MDADKCATLPVGPSRRGKDSGVSRRRSADTRIIPVTTAFADELEKHEGRKTPWVPNLIRKEPLHS